MDHGLAAKYFTDQSIFDRETERIFRTHWLCAGRADKVVELGAFFVVEIEDASLLVVRGRDGTLRTFHNVCRHRGSILCEPDTHGQLNDGCVVCPYHAWAYDDAGRLARAPNMQQRTDWDSGGYGLHAVACVEWNGYVMVRLGSQGASFDDAYATVVHKFAPWGMGDLVVADRLEYDIAANWKLLFHNYSECYHCPTVHPSLNRLTPYKSAANDLLAGAFLGGPMLLVDGVESMSLEGTAVASRLPGLDQDQQRQVSYYTLCPSMFISPHPDYVMVHRIERQAVDRTTIRCEFLFHPTALTSADCDVDAAVEFWDQTNRQDWEVCQKVQQGASTSGFSPGVYSPLETVLPHWDRYYRETMGAL